MVYIINTGCLTRYPSLQPTSYLELIFVQCMLTRRYYYSEVPIVVSYNWPQTEVHLQCAMVPKNFISLAFQFLIVKCVSKATCDEFADKWPSSQVYVTSFLALLNARHYLMRENTNTVDIPKAYHHGPLLHIKGSEAEKSQELESRKIVCQQPCPRPAQFVMVSICMIDDRKWLKKRYTLATAADCDDHGGENFLVNVTIVVPHEIGLATKLLVNFCATKSV
jgi:hypothetical protein